MQRVHNGGLPEEREGGLPQQQRPLQGNRAAADVKRERLIQVIAERSHKYKQAAEAEAIREEDKERDEDHDEDPSPLVG